MAAQDRRTCGIPVPHTLNERRQQPELTAEPAVHDDHVVHVGQLALARSKDVAHLASIPLDVAQCQRDRTAFPTPANQ